MSIDVARLHYKMQKAGLTGFAGVDENGMVSWDHAPSGSEVSAAANLFAAYDTWSVADQAILNSLEAFVKSCADADLVGKIFNDSAVPLTPAEVQCATRVLLWIMAAVDPTTLAVRATDSGAIDGWLRHVISARAYR